MSSTSSAHKVVVVGGGSAGIDVAARLLHGGVSGVAVIDPAVTHYYQPLWTLVGGGRAPLGESGRPQASVMPKAASWVQEHAESIDPDNHTVTTAEGTTLGYTRLVVCPGIQLDWNTIPGMAEGMSTPSVSSNYHASAAPKTWELIRNLRSGTAVFTMPVAVPESPTGYVEIDKNTLQHVRYPEVFALGDAGSSPNSKTGAAIRKQAPVVAKNVRASLAGRAVTASYDGYASCPLTTSRHTMLLAEFDYTMQPAPSFPFIDTTKERRDMWYLKRYGLPALYWNLMLKGRA